MNISLQSQEALGEFDTSELIDILLDQQDRVTRPIIDECARRGEKMVAYLSMLHQEDILWEPDPSDGLWWLRLHALMILGLIESEQAGLLLLEYMRRISLLEDYDLQDWTADDWPALFSNKPDSVLPALHEFCADRELDWFSRANALEPLIAAAVRQGGETLEQALAWLAQICSDEGEDMDFRTLAGVTLLEFPREKYRALLEDLADLLESSAENDSDEDCIFTSDDVQRAYSESPPVHELNELIFSNPWEFYEPEAIDKRRINRLKKHSDKNRHAQYSDTDNPDESINHSVVHETYVRPEPKVGRNDPCPCGSGKKYKKCCLAKDN